MSVSVVLFSCISLMELRCHCASFRLSNYLAGLSLQQGLSCSRLFKSTIQIGTDLFVVLSSLLWFETTPLLYFS
jgi:hypothetical protein